MPRGDHRMYVSVQRYNDTKSVRLMTTAWSIKYNHTFQLSQLAL